MYKCIYSFTSSSGQSYFIGEHISATKYATLTSSERRYFRKQEEEVSNRPLSQSIDVEIPDAGTFHIQQSEPESPSFGGFGGGDGGGGGASESYDSGGSFD